MAGIPSASVVRNSTLGLQGVVRQTATFIQDSLDYNLGECWTDSFTVTRVNDSSLICIQVQGYDF